MRVSASRTAIGLDIGSTRIKAAQLVRRRDGWRLAAAACFERTDAAPALGVAEVDRLLGVLDRAGFTGDAVVVGAPRPLVRSAVVDAPPRSSGAPVEQICAAEFSRMFRLPPGSCELHVAEVPTATARAATSQMAVSGMSCEDAEHLVAPFDLAGMVIDAIDLAAEARARACRAAVAADDDLTAVLDIGGVGVGISVFRAGEALFHRWLESAGLSRLEATVGRSLGVAPHAAAVLVRRVGLCPPEEPAADPLLSSRVVGPAREYADLLLGDVMRSLSYVLDRFPGQTVGNLRVVGGGALVPGLAEYLGNLAQIETTVIDPQACAVRAGPLSRSPLMLQAIGHAMWGRQP